MVDMREAEAIETRLACLRRDRGAATLAGKKFNSAGIASAEAELDALHDAAAEASRREREAAESSRLKQLGELRTQLAVLERDRLQDIEEAEAATRHLAAALSRVLRTNGEMGKVVHGITGGRVPIPLSGPDFVSRLAGRIGAIMTTIPNCRARFGSIEWRGHSLYRPDQNWKDVEEGLLKPSLKQLNEERTGNDGSSN